MIFKKLALQFIFIVLVLSNAIAQVVPPPDLRCVSVDPNGDVTLNWVVPTIPSGKNFSSYDVYFSSAIGGPYVLAGNVTTVSTSSFTHIGANANNTAKFYYVQTSYTPGTNSSLPSDTLQTINLSLFNNSTFGTADLSWNSIHTPLLATSSNNYNIYREFPTGNWSPISNSSFLTYKDTITFCNDSLNYKVEISDATCISTSSIKGGRFIDNTVPFSPTLLAVTVNPLTGIATINWSSSYSSDTKGYFIYQLQGSSSIQIATLSTSATTFTNILSSAATKAESYRIAAFDSCGNKSKITDWHKSMFLKTTLNKCSSSCTLSWNSYTNKIVSGIGGYNIYASINGGTFSKVGNVLSSDSTFTYTNVKNDTNYCFYVEVYNTPSTIIATSNQACFLAKLSKLPAYSYLRKASVINQNQVVISGYVDSTAGIKEYALKRSIDGITYLTINTLPFVNSKQISFTDNTAQSAIQSYFYKIASIDSCSNEVLQTNIGKTIYLQAIANDLSNTLTWNDYEVWLGNVASYNVYRKVDNGAFGLIGTIAYSNSVINTYVDDVSNQQNTQGTFYYYVEAIEGAGNSYGFSETSLSNIVEISQEPVLYIANAFNPSSSNTTNRIFKPISSFLSEKNYRFLIFDRWGQKVFETEDPSKGWDGSFHGAPADQDSYSYSLDYVNAKGESIHKKGVVTLIN